jgi:Fe-S cluster assembly protein SufD
MAGTTSRSRFVTAGFLKEFAARAEATRAEVPEWLDAIRRAALDRFTATGFPTPRDEEWRFTPVKAIAQGVWRRANTVADVGPEQLETFLFRHPEWTTLVFVNGVYDESLSSPAALSDGARVGSLSDAIDAGDRHVVEHLGRHAPVAGSPFTALSTAFMREGAVVSVLANRDVPSPVHLLFATTREAAGTVTHPRTLIVVEPGARVSLIESYVSLAPGVTYWTNPVTEVVAGSNSWIEHTRIQRESEQAYHTGLTHVEQYRDSHYRSFSMAMGSAVARHNLHVRLNEENIETLMYGLYLTRGTQVVDNHTAIYHDRPNCRSWEVYKGVLDGQSRAVFNGKVFVKPEAQKTDAKQTNRNLLLSDDARVNTKPQLEIFADDVKCTHGATVGRLDEVALFYARSRGVPAEEAQRLLTYAFAGEVISGVELAPVREELERLVRDRLGTV